jgi:hypothetical protein
MKAENDRLRAEVTDLQRLVSEGNAAAAKAEDERDVALLQARDLRKKLALVVIGVGGAVTVKERDVDLFEPDTVVLEEFHFGPDYVIRIADR